MVVFSAILKYIIELNKIVKIVMKTYLILVCHLFIFFLSNLAFAADKDKEVKSEQKCFCPHAKSVTSDFERSSVVFKGQVVETKPKYPLHEGYAYVRFLVLKKYKGFENLPSQESVVMFTQFGSEPCGVKFIKGNDYIVFAKGNPGFLKTSTCDVSGLLEDRTKEVLELEKLTTGK